MNRHGTDENPAKSIFNTVPAPPSFQVAGVDGCKAGWFVAVVSATKINSRTDAPCVFKLKMFLIAHTFAEVLSETDDCQTNPNPN